MPIQLLIFEDRFEVRSPGGLYGRLRIDQLGKIQPDTRNPVLAVAMEVLGETENRYSGMPTMRRELEQAGMPEPEFREERGTFVVCFRKENQAFKSNAGFNDYDTPLVEQGAINLSIPDKPKSPKQRYTSAQ